MRNLTIGGAYYAQVFGSSLPGPIWKMAMLAALETVPKTKFDLQTLDGLGTYVPAAAPDQEADADRLTDAEPERVDGSRPGAERHAEPEADQDQGAGPQAARDVAGPGRVP